jgi:hypothetical protein
VVITLKHFIGPIKLMKINVEKFIESFCNLTSLSPADVQITHLLANGAAEVTLTSKLPT